ncbi:Ham1-like protein [Clavulina sp. PMI_390]|nr:Ham1-like protein [Clavulina sp. PMI_390]
MLVRYLVFVTGNAMKLKEVKAFLGEEPNPRFTLVNQSLDLPEVQGTTQEVAIEKCKRAAQLVNGPVLVEDTALCFDAMNGLPGPYIKWFLKELGPEGLHTMLNGFSNKGAVALCTFAYSPGPPKDDPTKDPEVLLFEGRTQGTVVPPRGPPVFGWNPIFEVNGEGKTYAEMSTEEKNKISHRSRALASLRTYLDSLPSSS